MSQGVNASGPGKPEHTKRCRRVGHPGAARPGLRS